MIKLLDFQLEALNNMKDKCILSGGVGTGKSIVAISYYLLSNGGNLKSTSNNDVLKKLPLFIITTARKRDTNEWKLDLYKFNLDASNVTIDSWNNIKKYIDVKNAFFIFDEQKVVGYGSWVKSFLKITKQNKWILLSATPGDTWIDYIPVFIANGFYKNKTDFINHHVVYKKVTNYPIIDRYIGIQRLIRLRKSILIPMHYKPVISIHNEYCFSSYDDMMYNIIMKKRWNPYTNEPILNASEYCQCLRKVVNSDISKIDILKRIVSEHKKVIVFYNYDYELDILRNINYDDDVKIGEWNGHKHEELPKSKKWVYYVQYNAGAEGWNCIDTNTIVFYSLNYSYKIMAQAKGRINRLNTTYIDLYYYTIMSKSKIDLAIRNILKTKKKFNEGKYYNGN